MRVPLAAVALFLVSSGAEAADCNHPLPIGFAPGQTSVTLPSGPPTGSVSCYQVNGTEGQELNITVKSAEKDAVLALYAPGWQASCDASGDCEINGDLLSDEGDTEWVDELEKTGLYLIVVDNSRSDAEYQMIVSLQ